MARRGLAQGGVKTAVALAVRSVLREAAGADEAASARASRWWNRGCRGGGSNNHPTSVLDSTAKQTRRPRVKIILVFPLWSRGCPRRCAGGYRRAATIRRPDERDGLLQRLMMRNRRSVCAPDRRQQSPQNGGICLGAEPSFATRPPSCKPGLDVGKTRPWKDRCVPVRGAKHHVGRGLCQIACLTMPDGNRRVAGNRWWSVEGLRSFLAP
jgi:hypothetical protein